MRSQWIVRSAFSLPRQPSHHLPASIATSPHTTPAKIDLRVARNTASPAATAPYRKNPGTLASPTTLEHAIADAGAPDLAKLLDVVLVPRGMWRYPDPARLLGIMFERVTVKHGAHLGASQRQPEVARLRSLHRIHAQSAGLIGRTGKNFEIQTHEHGYSWRVRRNQAQSGPAN